MSKKGARKTGGNAGRARTKDSAMAARIKDEKRTYQRCPVCNKQVSLNSFENHIRTHN